MIAKLQNWDSSFWQEWLSKAPVLCVDAVIFNQKNEVLLVKRNTQPSEGLWHLPGGVVRKNELLENTVKRVVATEVGSIDFEIIEMLGVFDDPKRDPRGHFVTCAFRLKTSSEVGPFNSQGEAIKYFNNLPAILGFDAKKIIAKAKAKAMI
ncbi:MAG: DNA mismatch repair protein MutT [Candidatus Pacebacteria bacterium CG10_big_fil_rev_8_21_14_0_10_36_11]|nr:NUDIX hydrolase [Candidatus Pacearchaeota archaeon]OIP74202.1 MAG: hypothetical protein AUK08_03080 [Candidatus Pacebacteria bacterium CG2_30_36_39]PIR65105.1 MAG: DNA mismatch repair protein MutT [Candidatus Pacebacteria bacterium CG10_big_fil_rev_8_21_14_0_10_36_11]PJC42660.1 MAG: DNA mismatch repair protein MutT [Candidatus Pacebacteria bacterium CG_4_9_14_0_2_um_filter_36_8]